MYPKDSSREAFSEGASEAVFSLAAKPPPLTSGGEVFLEDAFIGDVELDLERGGCNREELKYARFEHNCSKHATEMLACIDYVAHYGACTCVSGCSKRHFMRGSWMKASSIAIKESWCCLSTPITRSHVERNVPSIALTCKQPERMSS